MTALRSVAVLRLALALATLGFWEAAVALGWASEFWVSSPGRIAARIVQQIRGGELWLHLAVTLGEAFTGLAAGVVAGAALGLLLGVSRRAGPTLEPFVIALNSLPRVALGPILVLYVGIGFASKFLLAFSLVVVPVMLNTYEGIRSVDQVLVHVMRMLGATRWQLFHKLLMPNALPWILSSVRAAVSLSIIGAIVGEFISAQAGIGYMLDVASGAFDITGMFAPLAVLMAFAFAADRCIVALSAHLLRWRAVNI